MVEIKALKDSGAFGACTVERAVMLDAMKNVGASVLINADDTCVIASGEAVYCLSDDAAAVENAVGKAALGRRCVVFCKDAVAKFCGKTPRRLVAYAYLREMPILPTTNDIKRLAPTLAQTVADALPSVGLAEVERLMRGGGVYGAIKGGKLVGFIGQSDIGGMDIFHIYDGGRESEIGAELVKFMTTLVMTGGRIAFALAEDNDDRRHILTECAFTKGDIFAYVI